MRFDELPLDAATLAALESMGFEEATPVQAETLPALLEGRDVIAQAQTGTGKTAAFGIPLVEAARKGHRGIVLTPTRELAKQVQREMQSIGKGSPFDVICLIGGASFPDQVRALNRHPNATLVATPGRVVDHIGRGTLDLSAMDILVLDEADEMLSMGFQDELDQIVAALPAERQTLLFTATLPPAIEKLARRALKDPVTIRASGGSGRGPAKTVQQCFALVRHSDRPEAVRRILLADEPKAALLFCKTRGRVDDLAEALRDAGAEALHGGMNQGQRDSVMQRFRDGKSKLLVATDVASRGLDVENVELVIHDEPAQDVETYIHRVGRTGRAGREGRSILMLGPGGMRKLSAIQHVAGHIQKIEIPTDADLLAMRANRLVADLAELEPGPNAQSLLDRALGAGMDLRGVALRALEMLVAVAAEPESDAADTVDDNATAALCLKVGLVDDLRPGDIVGMLANEGGLRGDQVGRIDLLPRMSVVEVPAREMPRLLGQLERTKMRGQWIRPREAEDWRFKNAPR